MIAIDLDIPSLIKLCSTNKRINSLICENATFWRNKLNKEYPNTIRKFPSKSDFRKIYFSLKNNIRSKYYIFISTDFVEDVPKIWSYIKRTPIEEDDYELAAFIYPDFVERMGEESYFTMVGDFPKGTKIWLAYCDDIDLGFAFGFLTKRETINVILTNLNNLIESDYHPALKADFEEELGETIEQFYGGTFEEVMNNNKRLLLQNGYLQIKGHDNRRSESRFTINYIIKEFELIDYGELLSELKRKNPDWRKLPKDMINYILSYLKN